MHTCITDKNIYLPNTNIIIIWFRRFRYIKFITYCTSVIIISWFRCSRHIKWFINTCVNISFLATTSYAITAITYIKILKYALYTYSGESYSATERVLFWELRLLDVSSMLSLLWITTNNPHKSYLYLRFTCFSKVDKGSSHSSNLAWETSSNHASYSSQETSSNYASYSSRD